MNKLNMRKRKGLQDIWLRPYLWYLDSFVLSIFNLSGGTAQSGRSHCSIQAEPLLNFAGRGDFAERRTQCIGQFPLNRHLCWWLSWVSEQFRNHRFGSNGSIVAQFHRTRQKSCEYKWYFHGCKKQTWGGAFVTTGKSVRDALRYPGGAWMQDLNRFVPNVHFEQIPIKNLVSNQEYQRPLSAQGWFLFFLMYLNQTSL